MAKPEKVTNDTPPLSREESEQLTHALIDAFFAEPDQETLEGPLQEPSDDESVPIDEPKSHFEQWKQRLQQKFGGQ